MMNTVFETSVSQLGWNHTRVMLIRNVFVNAIAELTTAKKECQGFFAALNNFVPILPEGASSAATGRSAKLSSIRQCLADIQ
jgi:hypothetical protein